MNKKVVSIILLESAKIEERCEGYRDAIVEVITEILNYERRHRISPTSIQKQINAKCSAAACFLAAHRDYSDMGEMSE